MVNALSKHYGPLFDRKIDPLEEILVTVGATEGLFATLQSTINPQDEVIIIQPFYDSYGPDASIIFFFFSNWYCFFQK